MKYDFDKIIERRNSGSLKWNVGKDELALWVADMDFEAAPPVLRAIEERAAHGIFGYNEVTEDWYDAIIGWWERRHGYKIKKDSLVFATGVVPAISSCVRKLTSVNEKVVLLTPGYNIFFNSVLNNGRRVVQSPLIYEKGGYKPDFNDLEKKLADKETTLMILCNPHNPVGKIWTREELSKIGDLCEKYSVICISDEIHCDITEPGAHYLPFAGVSPACARNSVTCISATKAFNLAGLQCAAVYSENENLLARVNRALNTDEVAEPNAFAVPATIAAFEDGEEWVDEMCAYTSENKHFVADFLAENIPLVKAVASKATYLCWLDCTAYVGEEKFENEGVCRKPFKTSAELAEALRAETGVYLSEGGQFGLGGEGFLRLNAACPRSVLKLALEKMRDFFNER